MRVTVMILPLTIALCWAVLLIGDTKDYIHMRKVSEENYEQLVFILADIFFMLVSLFYALAGMYHK